MENKRDMHNAEGWREALKNIPNSYQEWFKEEKIFLLKNIKKSSSILEVGCGDGRSMNDLLEISENLTGLDIDENTVKIATERFSKCKNVKIILCNANSLPFKNESFDYVICIGTFANFGETKFEVLEEMKRVLKKEGKIIISVYSDESLDKRLTMYNKIGFKIKRVEKTGTVVFDDFRTEGISEQFSEKQLREIANKVNLRVDEIQKTNNKIGYLCLLSKN